MLRMLTEERDLFAIKQKMCHQCVISNKEAGSSLIQHTSGVYKCKGSSLWSILSTNLWHQRTRFQELDIK